MDKIILFLARGLGSGLLKPAPGPWGSLLAMLLCYFIELFSGFSLASWWFILLCAVLGIYICDVAEEIIGVPDAGEIVFDEFVGMWITLLAVPHHFGFYVLAFALFRLFDITKIFPINNLQKLPGGLGIMIDDIVAGAMARIILAIILWVMTLI